MPRSRTCADEPWTLPIALHRCRPSGEEVVEFPLSQHRSGLESTSLIMDDKLMRSWRRVTTPTGFGLNVRMALVKEHIWDIHTPTWICSKSCVGLVGCNRFRPCYGHRVRSGPLGPGGGAFVLTGVAGLLMAQLDLHRISFSDHGDVTISTSQDGEGTLSDPQQHGAVGPAFVEFLRTASSIRNTSMP